VTRGLLRDFLGGGGQNFIVGVLPSTIRGLITFKVIEQPTETSNENGNDACVFTGIGQVLEMMEVKEKCAGKQTDKCQCKKQNGEYGFFHNFHNFTCRWLLKGNQEGQ